MLNKKIIALLLLVCLVVAGCGGKDNKQTTSESEDKTETVSEETAEAEAVVTDKEEIAKEENAEEGNSTLEERSENDHSFILYSLGGDEVAEITVPEFLTETYYTEVTITANDEMTYEATYATYTGWNTDTFFGEVMNVDSFIENDMFSNVEESEVETVNVNGNEAKWKKITTVYEGDMNYTQYAAAIEIEGGVIGITLYATNVPSENTELLEMLSGISLK